MSTPSQWLEEMQERCELMGQAAEPIDFFESGNGAMWLLCIADGLRALQAYCVSTTCPVLLVSETDSPLAD